MDYLQVLSQTTSIAAITGAVVTIIAYFRKALKNTNQLEFRNTVMKLLRLDTRTHSKEIYLIAKRYGIRDKDVKQHLRIIMTNLINSDNEEDHKILSNLKGIIEDIEYNRPFQGLPDSISEILNELYLGKMDKLDDKWFKDKISSLTKFLYIREEEYSKNKNINLISINIAIASFVSSILLAIIKPF